MSGRQSEFGVAALPSGISRKASRSTMLLRNGWAERTIAQEQLYDLLFDPNEADDIVIPAEVCERWSNIALDAAGSV